MTLHRAYKRWRNSRMATPVPRSLRDRKHRINVQQKADVGFPSLTQHTRSAIALAIW
jgi:hypothetical protein